MGGRGSAAGLELLTPDEMGQADRLAARLISSATLMENAGRAVAREAVRRFGPSRTVVLCGPGNNGGDGYVAARLLAAEGWPIGVQAWKPPRPGTDAAGARNRWTGPVGAIDGGAVARADLVIDALFGAGLRHPLETVLSDALAGGRRVLAVDLPSGVDGATGEARGTVRAADATVTFFRAKPGHLLEPSRTLCGALAVVPIGLPGSVLTDIGPRIWWNAPGLFDLRASRSGDHKYARGVVAVCGGASMGGAARLAAHAARRAGAGIVRLAAFAGVEPYRNVEPGLIVDVGSLDEMLADTRRTVWVCGPGLSRDEADTCLSVLLPRRGLLVVADGGALAARAGRPEALAGAAVLTPHEGEFTRLFGPPGVNRVAATREAARRSGAVVLLKGSTTVIAAPDGRVAINTHATPALATAGSGDVLAGLLGGMLANGLAPFEAACASAWLHGDAGRRCGDGLIAEDLADRLPAALAAARAATSGALVGHAAAG